MITFREFLVEYFMTPEELDYRNYKKDFEIILKESMDTSADILDIKRHGEYTVYYFEINDKKFRGILELSYDKEVTAVHFEQFLNGSYTTQGISNNLGAKETFELFGTLIKIVKKYAITSRYAVMTDSAKKYRTYMKLLTKFGAKNIVYTELKEARAVEIEFSLDEKVTFKDRVFAKFKYKKLSDSGSEI